MLQREQIDFLLTNAFNAAIRAGAKILETYNSDEFNINLKANSTPITIADKEAHNCIKNYLNKTRIPLMSEEGRDILFEERCNWDLYWLIDPLDGTKEFIKRNGEFTVNIALMVDNEPFFGVVYAPCFNKMYFSDNNRGAFMRENIAPDLNAEYSISQIFQDVKQLPLPEHENSPARIVISRSHLTPETYNIVEAIKKRHSNTEVIESGSSLKFCMVAEGSADYYIRTTNTNEWDVAAGDSVAIAAGAITKAIETQAVLKYNKSSLANPYFVCVSKFAKTKK